jgi:TfoX N-terminal domain
MARDRGLEALLREELGDVPGLAEQRMFGGLAWLLDGHLLCAASDRGMLIRLGLERDAWALALPDVAPLQMRGRPLRGWVRAGPDTFGDDALRRRLIDAALDFVRTLPAN